MTQSSKSKLIMSGVGLFASVLALSATAQADVKILPGSSCQPMASGNAEPSPFLTTLFNGTGESRFVECPLVRDSENSAAGVVDLDVVVTAGGANSGAAISCTAVSVSSQSGILRSVNASGNPVVDFGLGLFLAGEVSSGSGTLSRGSTYAVICNLPAAGTLRAIRYDE